MSARLSFLDTMFLDLEEANASAHMHIGGALIFDPLPGGGRPGVDRVRADLAARMHLLPRYTQRLSEPETSPISWRSWVRDERFDIAAHVRQATLPAPGGEDEFLEWLGHHWSHRLDRHRPLWQVTLVDGFADGRWAMVSKIHHCLVDGVGSLDIAYTLLDQSPDPAPVPAPPEAIADVDAPVSGFWLTPRRAAGHLRTTLGVARRPRAVLDVARTGAAMVDNLVRTEVLAAPRVSLNGPMSGSRRFAAARFDLDDIKAIKRERGGTVNDVVLALCTGGLRDVLLARGEAPPAAGLRAEIPVNVRAADAQHDLGNQLTTLYAELPVAEPDPLARYAQIVDRVDALKHSSQAMASTGLAVLSDAMPPAFGAALIRTLFGTSRAFNLTITNVPGPQQRFYAFGAPLLEILPFVPLFNEHRVGIAVVSYAGRLFFGVDADAVNVPDAGVIVEGIERAFEELSVPARVAELV